MIETGDITMAQWKPDSTSPGFKPEPNSSTFKGGPGIFGKCDNVIRKNIGENYSFVLRLRGERPLQVTFYQRDPFDSTWKERASTTINHGILGCIIEFPIRTKYGGRHKLMFVTQNSKGRIQLEQDLHVVERHVGG